MKKSMSFFVSVIVAVYFFSSLAPIELNKPRVADAYAPLASRLYNAVVFLTFADEGNDYSRFDDRFFEKVRAMYDESDYGVKSYFRKQSNGLLEIKNTFFGEKQCVALDHSADYYKPRYEWKNNDYVPTSFTDGYDNRWYDSDGELAEPGAKDAKQCVDGFYREQALVREISEKCDADDYDGDYDLDGKADSLVFITDVDDGGEWGEMLWGHMGVAYSFTESVLGRYYCTKEQREAAFALGKPVFGKNEIGKYNFLSAGEICGRKASDYSKVGLSDDLYDVGLLCHEMAHNLGIFDYYSYNDLSYESVGEFDVMANYTPVPQNMLSYLRLKNGWLGYEDILYVNSGGTYTLPFVGSGKGYVCAKIVLSDYYSTGEYFMIEARSNDLHSFESPFDSCLSGEGLIVYRVAESKAYVNADGKLGNIDYGNMYDDEVYVYRKNAQKKLSERIGFVDVSNALLGDGVTNLLSKFGEQVVSPSNNIISYSNGTNSSVAISDVRIGTDDTVTFSVSLPDDPKSAVIAMDLSQVSISRFYDGRNRLSWSSNVKDGKAYVIAIRTTDRLKRLAEANKANITIEDIKSGRFSYYKTLYTASVPLAEKRIKLPDFLDDAMIFLALETTDGLRTIRYVGQMENKSESFSQYIARIFDPVYAFAMIAFFLLILLVVVLLFTNKRSLKSRKG